MHALRSLRLNLLTALLAMLMLGLAPVPAAQAAALAPSADPAQPMARETVRLTGKLAPLTRPVQLQRRKTDGTWKVLDSRSTTTTGSYTFTTSVSATTIFRVVAPRVKLNGKWRSSVTTKWRALTPVAQTADVTRLDDPARIRVIFGPIRTGRQTTLQVNTGSGWSSAGVADRKETQQGAVNYALAQPTEGTWRYRVLAKKYRGAAAKKSAAVTVTAPPASGTLVRVSESAAGVASNGTSASASVSDDGRYVAFHSQATNLVTTSDDNAGFDVFVKDLDTGQVTLVSKASASAAGDAASSDPVISGSGNCVVFKSRAGDLVPDDDNEDADLFVWRRASNTITLITTLENGSPSSGGSFGLAEVTADCQFVVYDTDIQLDAEDDNTKSDVYRWTQPDTTIPGTNRFVSPTHADGSGDGYSEAASINDDGNLIAFHSTAGNLTDDGDEYDALRGRDIFVWDQATETLDRITAGHDDHSGRPSLNGQGTRVAYTSAATNALGTDGPILPGSTQHVIVRDLQTDALSLASRTTSNAPADESSIWPTLSSSGLQVAFLSQAPDLTSPHEASDDTDYDVFVRDLLTGVTTRVSSAPDGSQANQPSSNPEISGDGDHIAFYSSATNLVADDDNGMTDIFLWTRPAG